MTETPLREHSTLNCPIDTEARKTLREAMGLLISDKIDQDEFIQLSRSAKYSKDPGVQAIYRYAANNPMRKRVLGSGRVEESTELQRRATHAILFLQTELPYAWPPKCDCPQGAWKGYLILAAVGAVVVAAVEILHRGYPMISGGCLLLAGLLLLAHRWLCRHQKQRVECHMRNAGEYEVWPFISREQLDGTLESWSDPDH